jgi:hypothetical protein
MTGIFRILESSATQSYQDVAPARVCFFHRGICSLWMEMSDRFNTFEILSSARASA